MQLDEMFVILARRLIDELEEPFLFYLLFHQCRP